MRNINLEIVFSLALALAVLAPGLAHSQETPADDFIDALIEAQEKQNALNAEIEASLGAAGETFADSLTPEEQALVANFFTPELLASLEAIREGKGVRPHEREMFLHFILSEMVFSFQAEAANRDAKGENGDIHRQRCSKFLRVFANGARAKGREEDADMMQKYVSRCLYSSARTPKPDTQMPAWSRPESRQPRRARPELDARAEETACEFKLMGKGNYQYVCN